MKKTLAILLAVLMLFSAVSVMSVSAKATTRFELNGVTYYCKTGDTVTYSADIKTPVIIENGQFSLGYPSDLLSIVDYKFSDVLGKPIVNYRENIKDEFRFNFSEPQNGYNFTKEQFFFSVTFTVKAAGDGTIKLAKQVITSMDDKDVVSSTSFKEALNAPTTDEQTTITLAKKSASVYTKGTYKINATVVNGDGATTFKSADTKIAKVSSKGKVTGLKKGKTTIKVSNNGVSKKFTITVKNPSLKKKSATIKKGGKVQIKVNGSGKFKYSSKNKRIATVNKKGVVKGVSKGSTKIIVQANGKKLVFSVKVK